MSEPIYPMPLQDLRLTMLGLLQKGQESRDANTIHVAVSVLEYLKDAERWQYVESYEIPQGMSRNDTRKWVDQQMKEIDDDVERVVRSRQRRQDGVSGSSGAGGTPDTVV